MAKCVLMMLLLAVSNTVATVVRYESTLSSGEVNRPTYKVDTEKYVTKLIKECRKKIIVSGKGIGDKYSIPCSIHGLNIITTDQVLVVRNRSKKNALILYSDSPSVLVDVFNNKCTINTYTTRNGKTTYMEERMSESSCQEILKKVAKEEKMATTPVKEAQRKLKLGFQKMFPPKLFEALKKDKYVEEVDSPGWDMWGSGPR